jgi:hypothetical protein
MGKQSIGNQGSGKEIQVMGKKMRTGCQLLRVDTIEQ